MKIKSILIAAALMALPAFADSYLWWMVDESDKSDEFQFDYATVSLNGTTLNNQVNGEDLGTKVYNDDLPDQGLTTSEAYAVFTKAGSTFLFELYAGGELIAYKSVAYGKLSDYIMTEPRGQASAFTASDFTLVPEPTSGLLLLLGFAGLALRHKRA